jgi:predicted porin
MKKILLVLALSSAFAASAAVAAEATVYGALNASVGSVSDGATAGSTSSTQLGSDASIIGFKGSEDLGGGTAAVWQIESALNFGGTSPGTSNVQGLKDGDLSGTAPANNSLATRNTFVGLKSDSMGTLIIGKHDLPYKIAGRGYDVFADTIADNRSIMGLQGTFDSRANAIAYVSPSMNGFTVIGGIAFVSQQITSATQQPTKGNAWSLAGLYSNGPWSGSLAYQTVTIGGSNTGDLGLGGIPLNGGNTLTVVPNNKISAWRIGGSYTADMFQVNLEYDQNSMTVTNVNAGTSATQGEWYLSGKFNVTSNDVIKAAYTHVGDLTGTTNATAHQESIGYDHLMSKHTTIYALYTKLTNDPNAQYALGNSDATTMAQSTYSAGSSPSAFSVGMKHSF